MTNKNKLFHNRNAYTDLSIDEDIFTVIDRTITKFGKIKLRHRLAYCSADLSYLQDLTTKNYTINLDRYYVDKMKNALHSIHKIEESVEKWMIEQCNASLIYSWNIFNNRFLLSVTNKFKFTSLLFVVAFYVLVFLYLYYHNIVISPISYVQNIITSYYTVAQFMLYLIMSNRILIERTAVFLCCIYVGWILYQSYQSVNTCYEHYVSCNAFYEEYNQTYLFVNIAEEMCESDPYNDTDSVHESILYLKYYFTEDVSLGFSLVAKLSTDDYVKHMNRITNYIGRVDYQIGTSELLDYGYKIPFFVSGTFPILHIDGVWNPLITSEHTVKNSLMVDVMKPNVLIITGPNKAGKSTYARSVMICVYLAQSLGICCCDSMTLTPFRDLFTYLNIPDCIGKESLFEAELNRCHDYIEKTESLRGFSFGIIDELFTGTNPKEGKAGSYAILKRISDNPANITILNTHYYDILDKLDKHRFTFNKFTATKDNESDKYSYDYKIQTGITDQCIALELLKEQGFDKNIIDDALQFVKLL